MLAAGSELQRALNAQTVKMTTVTPPLQLLQYYYYFLISVQPVHFQKLFTFKFPKSKLSGTVVTGRFLQATIKYITHKFV